MKRIWWNIKMEGWSCRGCEKGKYRITAKM